MQRGEKGLQVLRDHVVEHRAARIPRCVGGHRWRHTSPHGQQGERAEVPEVAFNYTAHLFSIQAKKLTREYGGNMWDTPLCRRRHSALSAQWRWQKCVCFSYTPSPERTRS